MTKVISAAVLFRCVSGDQKLWKDEAKVCVIIIWDWKPSCKKCKWTGPLVIFYVGRMHSNQVSVGDSLFPPPPPPPTWRLLMGSGVSCDVNANTLYSIWSLGNRAKVNPCHNVCDTTINSIWKDVVYIFFQNTIAWCTCHMYENTNKYLLFAFRIWTNIDEHVQLYIMSSDDLL